MSTGASAMALTSETLKKGSSQKSASPTGTLSILPPNRPAMCTPLLSSSPSQYPSLAPESWFPAMTSTSGTMPLTRSRKSPNIVTASSEGKALSNTSPAITRASGRSSDAIRTISSSMWRWSSSSGVS